MKTNTTCIALALAASAALVSCDKKESGTSQSTGSSAPAATAPSATLTAVLAAAAAGEPTAIHTLRTSAKPGDEVTVSGKIMGNEKPFVDGRSAFILGDTEVLTPCNENPDDKCSTPWDNCCDSKEDKKRGIATIQVVDAEGRVLKEPIEGAGGLAKLSSVIVTGKVAEGSSADSLIINASAIRVAGK
ncbi:MAG: hypothetical protein EOP88_02505 [Verrucomicrobiaceae bacterium]|nr:MAG: hypothetical protein EOP88_02505 [Verrucomicrobiaceae bacterium]